MQLLRFKLCFAAQGTGPSAARALGLPASGRTAWLAAAPPGELRPGADPRGDAYGVNKRLERLEDRDEMRGVFVVLLRSDTA
eukprot:16282725-Heterocapsa_arctica.AAC.1